MKKLIFGIALITILSSLTVFTGCVRVDMSTKNGPLTDRSYDNTAFTGVDVGSAFKLEVTYGDSYNVTITAGEKLFDKITVSQTGQTLKVEINGWSFNWWWGHSTPKVAVTMPQLNYLHLSGASDGVVSGFNSDKDLTVELTGASELDIDAVTGPFRADLSGSSSVKGRLTASGTDISASGASDIDLTGSGGDIKLHASGASSIGLAYYVVQDADVDFSGASDGNMDVRGRLDVKLTGASSLDYFGNPTLGRKDVSGASDLSPMPPVLPKSVLPELPLPHTPNTSH